MKVVQYLAAIVVPPLGVYLARGITIAFWLGCLLTLLAWLPGMAFAVYTVATTPERG